MDCFDFQTVIAVIEATASLRHLRFAFLKTSSEQILSDNLVFVIVRAEDLMALFISSMTTTFCLSSLVILSGMVIGQAANILPINKPFVNRASK